MVTKTPLTPEQLEANFADLHPLYSRDEAAAEAARCLYCYDAPCTRACPTGIDVPRFIRQILHDDPASAAETIFEENIFGGSCARACPTEVLCEGACVDGTLLKDPVGIGRLQRYATDHAMEQGLAFFEAGPDTGRRVAVVGAGPAGLSCAHALRRQGHEVVVYEAREVAGGLNTFGIAAYKITTEFALQELDHVLSIGLDLRLGTPIDAAGVGLLLDQYDAVFVGVGLGPTAALGLPGEDAEGVWEALDFIFQTHTGPLADCVVGQHVVVIGAGNTAVDVATEAVRLGAETVTIAYRRSADEMPAFNYEYELAKADGVSFVWRVQPVAFEVRRGRLSGVEVQRVAPAGRGAELASVPGETFTIPCDMAVKALGQTPLADLLSALDGVTFERGRLGIDHETGATGVPGLFAGGDCTSRGAEIVDAVQEGKRAAAAIDLFLASNPTDA